MDGVRAQGVHQACPIVSGHPNAEDLVAIHANGRTVVHSHGHIDRDHSRKEPSVHAPGHGVTAPICSATLPPVKRW
jgi:hypothetical protein